MIASSSHLVMVQYGDYREAAERLAAGGPETYGAQRYSVSFVAGLSRERRVTVLALGTGPYDVNLDNGVRAVGTPHRGRRDLPQTLRVLESLQPTHLVVVTPSIPILAWGLLRVRRVLPLLADSFNGSAPKDRALYHALSFVLNRRKIQVAANHNFAAARDLVRIGVDPAKVVAWDWPAQATPMDHAAKEPPNLSRDCRIFYAGAITESKGVGDLVGAIAILRQRKRDVRLTIAGSGDVEAMQRRACDLGVASSTDFLGRVPTGDVRRLMREHDAVVIPSRHEYPEGLPLTIYEALCSRTPLLVSDHPMFLSALGGQRGVRFFPEKSPESLATSLQEVLTHAETYRELSACGAAAWEAIQVPLKFGELMTRWLSGTEADIAALRHYSLQRLGRV